jgi:hypothetical protein
MATATVGHLDEWATVKTIKMKTVLFFATWQRYSGKPIIKEDRVQLLAYLGSQEFAELCPLSTKARPKPVCDSADASIIVEEIYKDKTYFHTNCYRLQHAYLVIIQSLSSGHPGEFVVSGSAGYYHSDGGMEYQDHTVYVISNPNDPYSPRILQSFTSRNLKGHIENEDSHFLPRAE